MNPVEEAFIQAELKLSSLAAMNTPSDPLEREKASLAYQKALAEYETARRDLHRFYANIFCG